MTERQTNQLHQLMGLFRDPSPEALQLPTVRYLRTVAGRVRNERSVLSVADAAWLEEFWNDMIGKQRHAKRAMRRGTFNRMSST